MRIKLTNQVSGTNFRFKKDKKPCILSSYRENCSNKKRKRKKERKKEKKKERKKERKKE